MSSGTSLLTFLCHIKIINRPIDYSYEVKAHFFIVATLKRSAARLNYQTYNILWQMITIKYEARRKHFCICVRVSGQWNKFLTPFLYAYKSIHLQKIWRSYSISAKAVLKWWEYVENMIKLLCFLDKSCSVLALKW